MAWAYRVSRGVDVKLRIPQQALFFILFAALSSSFIPLGLYAVVVEKSHTWQCTALLPTSYLIRHLLDLLGIRLNGGGY